MKTIIITNPVGLHARPATLFCTEAKKYSSDIHIIKEDHKYNGKSLMSIMTACIDHGEEITIEAIGVDSEAAEIALTTLLEQMEA